MRILITGSNGLLGQKIVKRCLHYNIPFLATSKGVNRNPECPSEYYREMDICNAEDIRSTIASYTPDAIIHTAALTNVDYCEQHPEECHQVNVVATGLLIDAVLEANCHFELVSTDFVFDGEKGNYNETDEVGPLSVYAQSKVDAENLLLQCGSDNWSIARTIIVFGTGHQLSRSNLILWALEALPKAEPMKLVNDQFRAPTWADDLAYGCVEIVLRKQKGIFHLSGPDTYAIDEIVRRIAAHIGIIAPEIETISSSTLNQPAKRPPKTGFDLSKAARLLNYHPLTLEESVTALLAELSAFK